MKEAYVLGLCLVSFLLKIIQLNIILMIHVDHISKDQITLT